MIILGSRIFCQGAELKIGDEILMGKWKNKQAVIEGFSTDDKGQPVVETNKGSVGMYKFRIKKLMPEK